LRLHFSAQALRRVAVHLKRGSFYDNGIMRFSRVRRHLAVHQVTIERIEIALFRIAIAARARQKEADKIVRVNRLPADDCAASRWRPLAQCP
jgi:hypothetical protein